MSRHLYSNAIRKTADFLLGSVAVVSLLCFLCSLMIDNEVSVLYLTVFSFGFASWLISFPLVSLLNRKTANGIAFEKDKIKCQGKTRYKDEVQLRYFSFHISLLEPSLVFPKLQISSNDFSVTCCLSKRDIKRIEKLGYAIKWV